MKELEFSSADAIFLKKKKSAELCAFIASQLAVTSKKNYEEMFCLDDQKKFHLLRCYMSAIYLPSSF